MVPVVDDLEVVILVVEQGIGFADADLRVRVRVAAQLFEHLVDMVVIHVAVAAGPDELPRFQPRLLRHHQREQRVGRDVERHA